MAFSNMVVWAIVIALFVSMTALFISLYIHYGPDSRQEEIPELDVCQDVIVCSNNTTFEPTPGL